MNFSKVIISINIAATLPIAVQVAAIASSTGNEEAPSSDSKPAYAPSDYISKKIKQSQSKIAVNKKNFQLTKSSASSVIVDGVRLRPFMPGHRLPSVRDLVLVKQQAKLAPEIGESMENSTLNGRVSESTSFYHQNSYGNASGIEGSPYLSSAPRVVPHQLQITARQFIGSNQKKRIGSMQAKAIDSLASSVSKAQSGQFNQISKDIPSFWMASEKNLSLIESPQISEKELAQINSLIDQNKAAQSNDTAGPAPFPLNLLPQQSLKQLLGGRSQNRISAPQVSFGSWHQGRPEHLASTISSIIPNTSRVQLSNLANQHLAYKASLAKQTSKLVLAQSRHSQTTGVKVATYSAYNSVAAF